MAVTLSEDYDGKVIVVDSRRISVTQESMAVHAKELVCSGGTALAGDMLNVKPVIQIKGGMLEPCGKARGRKKARKMMKN